MSSSPSSVRSGFVRLTLLTKEETRESFYLEIPLDVIDSLCLKPRKYLLYLGWSILGIKGMLAVMGEDGELVEIGHEGDLDDGETYHWLSDEQKGAELAVLSAHGRSSCC